MGRRAALTRCSLEWKPRSRHSWWPRKDCALSPWHGASACVCRAALPAPAVTPASPRCPWGTCLGCPHDPARLPAVLSDGVVPTAAAQPSVGSLHLKLVTAHAAPCTRQSPPRARHEPISRATSVPPPPGSHRGCPPLLPFPVQCLESVSTGGSGAPCPARHRPVSLTASEHGRPGMSEAELSCISTQTPSPHGSFYCFICPEAAGFR